MRFLVVSVCLLSVFSIGQETNQAASPQPQVGVPHLIRISGQIPSGNSTVGVTFSLYKSQTDTAPLWTEMQNIALDASGKYNALVGATKAEGIPLELFASGEAQWLGIRREGQAEQPRILLVSVPYAMKAAEAETLAGHTAAEFVTQVNLGEAIQLKLHEPEIRTMLANPFLNTTTPVTAGATNFVDSTTNQIVAITQNGTGRLITGSGPSHTQVFAVDQNGQIHGSGLALDGSAGRTIGMGNNSTSGGAGYQLVVRAGESAVGSTNKRGGQLQLAAGPGTGSGGSGDVVIQTAPPGASGTTVDSLITRHLYPSSPVSMAPGYAVLAGMPLQAEQGGAVQVRFMIYASDGGSNYAVASGECVYVQQLEPAGHLYGGTATLASDYTEEGFGKIGGFCGLGISSSVAGYTFEVGDSLSFTPTVHTLTYELHNLSGAQLTLLANTSSAEKKELLETTIVGKATHEHPQVVVRQSADGAVTVVEGPKRP